VTYFGKRIGVPQEEKKKGEEGEEEKKEGGGLREPGFMDEGWNFFPFYPFVYGYVSVNVAKKNLDFKDIRVWTPDNAEVVVPISITYTPDKNNLVTYLDHEGEKGVGNILRDIVQERVREWAGSIEEGPGTWEEAVRFKEEATFVLAKAVAGETLKQMPSSLPTLILVKYFAKPKPKPLTRTEVNRWASTPEPSEEKEAAEQFAARSAEALEKISKQIESDASDAWCIKDLEIAPEEKDGYRKKLEELVHEREGLIRKIRQGSGGIRIEPLGIILDRLNVGDVTPLGEVAQAASHKAKEKQERDAEVFEIDTDVQKAKKLMEAAKTAGQPLSFEDAYRTVLEWKTTREGRGFTIPGLNADVIAALAKILGRH
jgi:regulator of protease activity HflC (stomatin/prohibitin superfamily)